MSAIELKNIDILPVEQIANVADKKVVIAIDGPSASGKGTLGRMLAGRLNYAYLDTGSLYRAVGLATLELQGDPSKIEDVRSAIEIVLRNLTSELLASPFLRSPEASSAASKVAALPEVREALVNYQRDFAENPPNGVGGVILDGRDIGTVICPDADLKFFITADVEERARRRFNEIKVDNSSVTPADVLQDMQERDLRDSTREVSPTKAADDAHILDMTEKSPAQGIDAMIDVIKDKMLSDIEAEV